MLVWLLHKEIKVNFMLTTQKRYLCFETLFFAASLRFTENYGSIYLLKSQMCINMIIKFDMDSTPDIIYLGQKNV